MTTDELVDHYRVVYADHPQRDKALRLMRRTGVHTHWLSRPLAELSANNHPARTRLANHHEDAIALAERAAREALVRADATAEDISSLVCVGTGGHTIPGIDIHLINRLRLPPTVRRLPITQTGCAGGLFALARAWEALAATTIGHSLVVAADLFVPFINPADTGVDNMIFRAIMSDAAAACVIRRDCASHGFAGLAITDIWDYTVPATADTVGATVGRDGMHLHNSPRLYDALTAGLPHMPKWFESAPEFVISHPGGPHILDTLAEALQLPAHLLDHSRHSLRDLGNAGSVSILDVTTRYYDTHPAPGTEGLLFAIGPGVSLIAAKSVWQ